MLGGLINIYINVKVGGGKTFTVEESFVWNPKICIAKTTLTEVGVIGWSLMYVITVFTLTTVYCTFWVNACPCYFALVWKKVSGVAV